MGTKSILDIIEAALVANLQGEADLAGYQIRAAAQADKIDQPDNIIVACESAGAPPGLAQGLGNYLCRVSVGIFTQIDSGSLAAHRTACQNAQGRMEDQAGVKASFAAIGDAAVYYVDVSNIDEGRGDRAFMTTLNLELLVVLAAV
jgi:hypothetical protein